MRVLRRPDRFEPKLSIGRDGARIVRVWVGSNHGCALFEEFLQMLAHEGCAMALPDHVRFTNELVNAA